MRSGSRTGAEFAGMGAGQRDVEQAFADDYRRRRASEWLVAHGIDTMMVSIPKIARAMGYSPATLYGYIKAGRFFLPHRLVNGSPMVALDHLLDWVCDKAREVRADAVPLAEPEDQVEPIEHRMPRRRNAEDPEIGTSEIDRARRKMMERAIAKVDRLGAL